MKKSQVNFMLPKPVVELFNELSKSVNRKQKWLVISAALLTFAETAPEARGYYVARVSEGDLTKTLADVIKRAKRGELAKEAMTGLVTQPVPQPKSFVR